MIRFSINCAKSRSHRIHLQTAIFSLLADAPRRAILPVMLIAWACATQSIWAQDDGREPGAPTEFPLGEPPSIEPAPLNGMVVENAPTEPTIVANAVAVFS